MYCKVRKPYSGAEGRRVKPGEIFFVQTSSKEPKFNGVVISQHRFKDLERLGIVAGVTEKEAAAAMKAAAAGKAEPRSRPPRTPAPAGPDPKAKVDPDPRTKAQAEALKEHRGRTGGRAGKAEQPSLSPEAHQSLPSGLKLRGVRQRGNRSNGSESIEAPTSSPTDTLTGVTPDGGAKTDDSSNPIEDAV